jgi:hypothetical protein
VALVKAVCSYTAANCAIEHIALFQPARPAPVVRLLAVRLEPTARGVCSGYHAPACSATSLQSRAPGRRAGVPPASALPRGAGALLRWSRLDWTLGPRCAVSHTILKPAMADHLAAVAAAASYAQRIQRGELNRDGGVAGFTINAAAEFHSRNMPAAPEATIYNHRNQAGQMGSTITGFMADQAVNNAPYDGYVAPLPGELSPRRKVVASQLHGGELTGAGGLSRFIDLQGHPDRKPRGWSLRGLPEKMPGITAG